MALIHISVCHNFDWPRVASGVSPHRSIFNWRDPERARTQRKGQVRINSLSPRSRARTPNAFPIYKDDCANYISNLVYFSFVVSAKNPNAPGPANATLDNPASYPEDIQKKFRNLRWMPLEPELLKYQNTQFLLIGEGIGEMGNAVQEMSEDAKDDTKETPIEEIQKLEEEDHDRVEHLKGDDPVFADLGLSSKEYSTMQTTW